MKRRDFMYGLHDVAPLSDEERKQIIKEFANSTSKQVMTVITMEEMAELQQQLSKQIRHIGSAFNLFEEVADVYISLSIIREIYSIDNTMMNRAIDVKINELKKKIADKKEE